jgi:hypothetical protein
MYPLETINGACRECHPTHDVPAAKVVALWLERHPAGKRAAPIACTDCHGAHRLKLRTVRWDKKTRRLIRGKDEGRPPAAIDR